MSSICYNTMTIISLNVDSLDHFIDNRLLEYFHIFVIHRSNTKIIVTYQSLWTPPVNWLSDMLNDYPSFWIKNEWHTDNGAAGIWIASTHNDNPVINQMDWQIPPENI